MHRGFATRSVMGIVTPSGGATEGVGIPPATSRQDQFSHSSKFNEKLLGLG